MARAKPEGVVEGAVRRHARHVSTRLVYSTGGETPEPSWPAEVPAKPRRGGIRLRLDRGASGRVVTLVGGLPGTPEERADLARALKRACGAGGIVNGDVLELQGDQRERVEAALAARGLKSKLAGG